MKGLITGTQKRQYKTCEAEDIKLNIADNSGIRSPKASPRRTPKKRKSRPSFRIPSCKRTLDIPSSPNLSTTDIPELGDRKDNETFPSLDISDSDGSDSEDTGIFSNNDIEVLSVKKSAEFLLVSSETCEEDKVKEKDEIRIVGAPETEKSDDKDSSAKEELAKDEPVKDDSDLNARDKGNIEKDKSEKEKPAEVKSVDHKSAEEKSAEEKSTKLDSVKLESAKDKKKSDDVDEGYFDSSYIDLEKILEKPNIDVSTSTLPPVTITVTGLSQNYHRTVTKDLDLVDILNRDFQSKLCLTTGVQTDKVEGEGEGEGETKRRKVSKACQITDEAVNTLNKKLLNLRNKLNKVIVEKDSVVEKNSRLEGRCSGLNTERLSLLAQTEALQNECVKKMYDNDKLTEKVSQKECHVATLKESLVLRDKELNLLHRQPNSTAGLTKQINEYRELEMLRVDNIRLLHDNRALTGSLDSLNGQLCALRRISRNYDECKDSVILMNKRLAQDNGVISANLSSVKRELKSVSQEHQETLEEVRYLRASTKRSADQCDAPHKDELCNDVTEDNRVLCKQNSELKHCVEMLRGEVDTLHTELSNTRSAHSAFDKVLQEKCDLQKQLQDVESRNDELWTSVEDLRHRCAEQCDTNRQQTHEHNIVFGENEELRAGNEELSERVEVLRRRLDEEVQKNAGMAKQIEELTCSLSDANLSVQDLHNTMEFLQVEHSFIEADVENKNESIHELNAKIEELSRTKEDMVTKCKTKLREKTKKLNASRIKLGYALLEMRELNSHGSSCSE
ncbi:myosin heavy chain, clone 203-like [Bolinopsis microptera]|uniref:myosin heavy chain, clone 203-like n=1 Tax=Bolinopsis microptera TaxID=2820187 RepID=UPI003078F07B